MISGRFKTQIKIAIQNVLSSKYYFQSTQPTKISKKLVFTPFSPGRDFRNPSYSAGNQRAALNHASHKSTLPPNQRHQPFQRNNSVESPQTQARVLHGTQSSSYNSMSQFQRSQQMQRQGSGSSSSMLFSGNGTGLVQSRQAGRISINAGSMAGRTGVMRFSTDSQSSFGAR